MCSTVVSCLVSHRLGQMSYLDLRPADRATSIFRRFCALTDSLDGCALFDCCALILRPAGESADVSRYALGCTPPINRSDVFVFRCLQGPRIGPDYFRCLAVARVSLCIDRCFDGDVKNEKKNQTKKGGKEESQREEEKKQKTKGKIRKGQEKRKEREEKKKKRDGWRTGNLGLLTKVLLWICVFAPLIVATPSIVGAGCPNWLLLLQMSFRGFSWHVEPR